MRCAVHLLAELLSIGNAICGHAAAWDGLLGVVAAEEEEFREEQRFYSKHNTQPVLITKHEEGCRGGC